jgi:hypothetical protein
VVGVAVAATTAPVPRAAISEPMRIHLPRRVDNSRVDAGPFGAGPFGGLRRRPGPLGPVVGSAMWATPLDSWRSSCPPCTRADYP